MRKKAKEFKYKLNMEYAYILKWANSIDNVSVEHQDKFYNYFQYKHIDRSSYDIQQKFWMQNSFNDFITDWVNRKKWELEQLHWWQIGGDRTALSNMIKDYSNKLQWALHTILHNRDHTICKSRYNSADSDGNLYYWSKKQIVD